jgi:alpha/beta superfamily hydrolase
MKIPTETKPAFWGAVAGAVALAIVGFNWGGWVTGGKAEADATRRSTDAVTQALAPICVERFQQAADAAAQRAVLKKTEAWSQGEFVEKGGWAKLPGSDSPERVSAVAKACATLIVGA